MNMSSGAMQKGFRVLIVEDDRTVQKVYEKIFANMGYQHQIVSTGEAAYQAIAREKFDLICLDLKLPDINGIDLVEKLKRELEWIPVIIVTANPSLESSIEAISAGIVTEYIIKPFDSKEMILTVRKAIEKARLSIENKRLMKRLETTNQALLERVEQLEQFGRDAEHFQSEVEKLKKYVKDLEQRIAQK
ncbi:MAG: response regulator [Candidatus Omnitrophota bacterium]|nr:response regulator [Candidatus Omnitrophota bacterium]MDZ4241935.1 response regulator [Candidatus Omnitrophota bacterium]